MSCLIELNTEPFQYFVNNTLLKQLANTTIPPNANFTGTFNSFDIDGISFKGSGGNSTCAGYDYNYSVYLNSLQNAMDFEIVFPSSAICLTDLSTKSFPSTVARSYQYKYLYL